MTAARVSANDILEGHSIQLELLSNEHREGLCTAADEESIWQYMPYKPLKECFEPWFYDCIDKMQSGEQITYVIRQKACQTIVGTTSYYALQLEHNSLALGYSWHTPDLWGTKVNPEAKLLMLTQAFEHWEINRIEIGTDSRNIHSYNAIKKLGATEEGLLRQHMILHDKTITDTIVFSILLSEWPAIKINLINRLTNDVAD